MGQGKLATADQDCSLVAQRLGSRGRDHTGHISGLALRLEVHGTKGTLAITGSGKAKAVSHRRAADKDWRLEVHNWKAVRHRLAARWSSDVRLQPRKTGVVCEDVQHGLQ